MADPRLFRPASLFLPTCALAHAGSVIGWLPLLSVLLPLRVEALAGDARIELLSLTVILGGLVASLANILFGWLSDLALHRGVGRRQFMALGLVALAAAYAGLAAADGPATTVAAVAAFQLAVNAMIAPLFALLAEEVPDAHRGLLSGFLALGQPLAAGLVALLLAIPWLGEAQRLLVIPLVVACCIAPLLLTRGEAMVPDAPVDASLPQPRRSWVIAIGARALVQVAGTVLSVYLLYYLESIAGAMPPRVLAQHAGTLLMAGYILPLPVAVLAGRLSDRSGRRRPFLLGAAIIAAVGIACMAAARTWTPAAAAFCLYAIGSTTFLALHTGYAFRLLPDPNRRGRDMGLFNLSNTVPAVLGPLIAWSLATPHDFAAMLILLAVLTACGGLLMLAVPAAVRAVAPRPASGA